MGELRFDLKTLLDSAAKLLKENKYLEALKAYDYILSNNILLNKNKDKAIVYEQMVKNIDYTKVDLSYYKNILNLTILYNPKSLDLSKKVMELLVYEGMSSNKTVNHIKTSLELIKEEYEGLNSLNSQPDLNNCPEDVDNNLNVLKKYSAHEISANDKAMKKFNFAAHCRDDARIFYMYLIDIIIDRSLYEKRSFDGIEESDTAGMLPYIIEATILKRLEGEKPQKTILEIISIIEQRNLSAKVLLKKFHNNPNAKNIYNKSICLYLKIKNAKILSDTLIDEIIKYFNSPPVIENSEETIIRFLIAELLPKNFANDPKYCYLYLIAFCEFESFRENMTTPLHILINSIEEFNYKEFKIPLSQLKKTFSDLSSAYGKFTNINKYITVALKHLKNDQDVFNNFFQLIYEVMDLEFNNTQYPGVMDFKDVWKSTKFQSHIINYLYNVDSEECMKMQEVFIEKIIPNKKNKSFLKELLVLRNIPDKIKIIILKHFQENKVDTIYLNSKNNLRAVNILEESCDIQDIEYAESKWLFEVIHNYANIINEYYNIMSECRIGDRVAPLMLLHCFNVLDYDYSNFYTYDYSEAHGFAHGKMKPIVKERLDGNKIKPFEEIGLDNRSNCTYNPKKHINHLLDLIYVNLDDDFYKSNSYVDFSFSIASSYAMLKNMRLIKPYLDKYEKKDKED